MVLFTGTVVSYLGLYVLLYLTFGLVRLVTGSATIWCLWAMFLFVIGSALLWDLDSIESSNNGNTGNVFQVFTAQLLGDGGHRLVPALTACSDCVLCGRGVVRPHRGQPRGVHDSRVSGHIPVCQHRLQHPEHHAGAGYVCICSPFQL